MGATSSGCRAPPADGDSVSMVIKGGEPAIRASHRLLAEQRRGDPAVPELTTAQVREQLGLGVDRVMGEGALYDRDLAALAIKQAQCDLVEAAFLLRAFRTTLRRFGVSEPIATERMSVRRRVAPIYKQPPGGQFLGATYDYTHRFLDFALAADTSACDPADAQSLANEAIDGGLGDTASPFRALAEEGLLESSAGHVDAGIADLTRQPLPLPAGRDLRLQVLARADEGFMLGLAYASLQSFGRNHPYLADLKVGEVAVEFVVPELGFAITLGEITVTECQTLHQTNGAASVPLFTRGYGLVLGQAERRAISVAVLDRSLRARELAEEIDSPLHDEEFVLAHCDNIASSGLVQHLKLPHYVDFQGQLTLMREMRARLGAAKVEETP